MMAINIITNMMKGHSTIARVSNDTQLILTQEPCCPIKSMINIFHPLNNINELFANATQADHYHVNNHSQ